MVCLLSVVIKVLNEEANIGRTLDHVLAAIEGLDAEVIVADSLSDDATVLIAKRYAVTVVQLANIEERGCGVGGQLGFQHSQGSFILVMDGDMDLQREFVRAALARLAEDPGLGGVGGVIEDVNFDNLEYRARKLRAAREASHGAVDRLYGGGLFRREAIEAVGYYTNRNLHACEELELGLRLRAANWRLERLPMLEALHHGHTIPVLTLMRRRWQSRYSWGGGELLRAALGKPYFWGATRALLHPLMVVAWWATLLASAAGVALGLSAALPAFLLLTPFALLVARKRSLLLAGYSFLAWQVDAAGLVRGVFSPQVDPRGRVPSIFIAKGSPNGL